MKDWKGFILLVRHWITVLASSVRFRMKPETMKQVNIAITYQIRIRKVLVLVSDGTADILTEVSSWSSSVPSGKCKDSTSSRSRSLLCNSSVDLSFDVAGLLFRFWQRNKIMSPQNLEKSEKFKTFRRICWTWDDPVARSLLSKENNTTQKNLNIHIHASLELDSKLWPQYLSNTRR
jgi:hypothetical protein